MTFDAGRAADVESHGAHGGYGGPAENGDGRSPGGGYGSPRNNPIFAAGNAGPQAAGAGAFQPTPPISPANRAGLPPLSEGAARFDRVSGAVHQLEAFARGRGAVLEQGAADHAWWRRALQTDGAPEACEQVLAAPTTQQFNAAASRRGFEERCDSNVDACARRVEAADLPDSPKGNARAFAFNASDAAVLERFAVPGGCDFVSVRGVPSAEALTRLRAALREILASRSAGKTC